MKAKATGVLIGALYVGAGAAMVRGAFLLHPAAGWLALALCVLAAAAGWLMKRLESSERPVGLRVNTSETPQETAAKMAAGVRALNRAGCRLYEPQRVDHKREWWHDN